MPDRTLGREAAWADHDWEAEPAVQLLREYVRIDTSAATGDEQRGAEWLAQRLRAAGVEPQVELLGERNANLWAILEGESREALVLHHHIDVEDAGPVELWEHLPFAAVYDEPWLIGRGVFDMKSVGVAQLLAFLDAVESGRRPRRSLILLATGDEETGSDLGMRWLLRRHPDLVERFWAVLTEGGVVEAISPDEVKYWGIEVAQKQFARGSFCAASRERLETLRVDLERHSRNPVWPRRLPPEVQEVLAAYASTRTDPELERLLGRPAIAVTDVSAFRRLPTYLRSMFRDELVPFAIEEDPEGGYRLPFALHLLPGADAEAAAERLLPDWMLAGVSLQLGPPLGAGHGSPFEHPVADALRAAVRRRHPDAPLGPWLVPWSATDSRFLRAAEIPAYGFSPFLILSTDTYYVGLPNERMAMPAFVDGVELYRDAVRRLLE